MGGSPWEVLARITGCGEEGPHPKKCGAESALQISVAYSVPGCKSPKWLYDGYVDDFRGRWVLILSLTSIAPRGEAAAQYLRAKGRMS